jgi:polyisoprenoid-binding protein YceI
MQHPARDSFAFDSHSYNLKHENQKNMATTTWTSDAIHSDISFKVRHLMITSVRGSFSKFEVSAESDGDDFKNAKINARIDPASIATGVADRDAHLRSADFFDVDKYPDITFTAQGVRMKSNDEFEVTGDLTIHGVTKSITLEGEFGGVVKDPYGQIKAGFTVEGTVNRKDFGLTWSAVTEAGGVVVADNIQFVCDIQLIKQA